MPGWSNRRRDRDAAFGKLRNWLPSRRTCPLVLAGTDGDRTRVTLAQKQVAAAVRQSAEESRRTASARHGNLGLLEGDIAAVADDLRADLDKLLLQAGQGPVTDWLGHRESAQEVTEIIG
jgi:hypothetical protein